MMAAVAVVITSGFRMEGGNGKRGKSVKTFFKKLSLKSQTTMLHDFHWLEKFPMAIPSYKGS